MSFKETWSGGFKEDPLLWESFFPKGGAKVIQGEYCSKGNCMHVEPEAIQHGQSTDKEDDSGIQFMTQPGSTH